MAVLLPVVSSSESVFVAYYPRLLLLHAIILYFLILWALRQQREGRTSIRSSPFVLPVIAYLAIGVLSIFQAVNPVESMVMVSQQIALTFLFLYTVDTLRTGDLVGVLPPFVGAAAVLAVVGLVQYIGWGFLWIPTTGMPSSTFGYRNFAAMYMVLCIPLGCLLFARARHRAWIWAWSGATTLMSAFVIATRTRSAWGGLLVSAGIAAVVVLALKLLRRLPDRPGSLDLRETRRWAAACGLFVLASFILLTQPSMGRIGYETQSPSKVGIAQTLASVLDEEGHRGRPRLWESTLDMVWDHALLGVGIGNWQFIYPRYDRARMVSSGAAPRRPHNDYLWIAADLGLPGLLVYLWIIGLALFTCVRLALSPRTRAALWTPLYLCASFVAILVHAGFSFPRERIAVSALFWFLLACIALLDRRDRPKVSPGTMGWRMAPVLGVPLLALCLLLSYRAVAFDRHHARSLAYAELGRWHDVIHEVVMASRKGDYDPQLHLISGVAFLSQRNYARSAEDNRRCLDHHPYLVNAMNNLGMAYNGMGRHTEALDVLRRLLEIDPDHIEAKANLGLALKGLGRLDQAEGALRQALDASGGSRKMRAVAHQRLGDVYLQRGRLSEALTAFRASLSEDSTYAAAHFGLGEVHFQQADTARALASFKAFLDRWRGGGGPGQMAKQRIQTLEGR
jgi:tetratricopeptide (TPR) repeat protein